MSENQGYYSSNSPNSTLAIIALVAGILGVTLFPILGSLVAVIAGPMAKREIDESGGTLGGESLASIGIILGWVGLALSFVGCCIAFGVIGFSFAMVMTALGFEEMSQVLPFLLFV